MLPQQSATNPLSRPLRKRSCSILRTGMDSNAPVLTTAAHCTLPSFHNTDPGTIYKLNNQSVAIQYKIPAGYTYDILLEQIDCIDQLNQQLQSILNDRTNDDDILHQYNTTIAIQHNDNDIVEYLQCMKYDTLGDTIDKTIHNQLIPLDLGDYMSIGVMNKSNNTVYELNKILYNYTIDLYNAKLRQHNKVNEYVLCSVSYVEIEIFDIISNHKIHSTRRLCYTNSTLQPLQQHIQQYLTQLYNNETVQCQYYRAVQTSAGATRSKKLLNDFNHKLIELNFYQKNVVLLCHVVQRCHVERVINTNTMQLSIELLNNQLIYLNELTSDTPVSAIKQQVQQHINLLEQTQQFYIIYQNESLDDSAVLSEYDIANNARLQVLQVLDQYDDHYVYYNKLNKNNYIKLNNNSISLILELIDYMNNLPLIYTLNDMRTDQLQKLLLYGRNLMGRLYEKIKCGVILGNNKHGHRWITDEQIVIDNIINLVSPIKKRSKIYAATNTIQLATQIIEDTTSILQRKHIKKPRKLHSFSFTSADHVGRLDKPLNNELKVNNSTIECVNLISPITQQQPLPDAAVEEKENSKIDIN